MKGRCSKQEAKEGMEIDRIRNSHKDEPPQLSGAYIRSLVKQLTTSRSAKDPDYVNGQNLSKFGEGFSATPQTQSQVQPHAPPKQLKKQVRRRFHTRRPYQQRLLNMAEARREIVTALKFHRAAMKQANEQQLEEQSSRSLQPSPSFPPPFEQEPKTNNLSTYNIDYFSHSYSWPPSSPSPFTSTAHTLNLPDQTLGLNLNFHDFNNIDSNLYHNRNNPSIYSSSSSSSSPTLSVVTEDVPSVAVSHEVGPGTMADSTASYGGGDLHQAMDDEGMAEMRSLGEQHQMEWNDTVNLVTSAWWFKFLKSMEDGNEVKGEDDGYHKPFDQVMELPAWLNANDCGLQHHHFNNLFPDSYFQDSDSALPCMDIGEIDGIDGDWHWLA
ncbi:hypothetical protein ES332_D06G103200v1 [Gossypium tomentosum]|uniref:Uncharacterized protein n=1 Tax=Gossypium tomentosum TaxID=34277 RepID=A0A5D2KHS3_GOSTO|nr:hypothetical protein ES332_D06G103200v1 [Gossypium tomentosum]